MPAHRLLAPVAAALLGAGDLAALTLSAAPALSAEATVRAPAPATDAKEAGPRATAVFAGGCFWGVQGVYSHVKGVESAVSGYTGGNAADADYERVSSGETGHAESVRITYDPRVVSYGRLLQVYFSVVADPTQLNRQGPDSGTQYRSAIFPTSAEQNRVARAYLAQLGRAGLWPRPVVTRIERAQGFFPAEPHHQDFLARNPGYPYIVYNDLPKVAALKAMYPQLWRAQPVLVRKG